MTKDNTTMMTHSAGLYGHEQRECWVKKEWNQQQREWGANEDDDDSGPGGGGTGKSRTFTRG